MSNRTRNLSIAKDAHYDAARDRVVVVLQSGLELAFAPRNTQELEHVKASRLRRITITPSGLGLHFPQADADIYLPALLEGLFGSCRWMAARLGHSGGRSRSAGKIAASRTNGKLGGRPRKLS